MNINIKNTFRTGIVATAGLVALFSCTDTWNEHYDSVSHVTFDGTAMQALEVNAPQFAKVVKAAGFDRELNADGMYTIWAPQDGSFNLSDYVDENGKLLKDSATVVDQFIKNHIARFAFSADGSEYKVNMMSNKMLKMTSDYKIEGINIVDKNISCNNGLIHVVGEQLPYKYNIFERIVKSYEDSNAEGKDTCSLYAFLKEWDADSLDENKSVSRGLDADGKKIWVDSVMIRNNTMLNNFEAKVYSEDSNYVAIIPSTEAWQKRVADARKLLVFNESENIVPGVTDSLTNYYANAFAMTDLFYNMNLNGHAEDSLVSTNYSIGGWPDHVYYTKEPKTLPDGKFVNDILGKVGEPIECSNGTVYATDEYPMSVKEQYFKPIELKLAQLVRSLDESTDANNNTEAYSCKSLTVSSTPKSYTYRVPYDDGSMKEYKWSYCAFESSNIKTQSPTISFRIPNTLSGTYDIYFNVVPIIDLDAETWEDRFASFKPYRFQANIWERQNKGKSIGKYPSSAEVLYDPVTESKYFVSTLKKDEWGFPVMVDSMYLGTYTFKNAYYGRTDEGVILQIKVSITNAQSSKYSRNMNINSIVLKPRLEGDPEVVIEPESAKKRENALQKRIISFKQE